MLTVTEEGQTLAKKGGKEPPRTTEVEPMTTNRGLPMIAIGCIPNSASGQDTITSWPTAPSLEMDKAAFLDELVFERTLCPCFVSIQKRSDSFSLLKNSTFGSPNVIVVSSYYDWPLAPKGLPSWQKMAKYVASGTTESFDTLAAPCRQPRSAES